MARNTNGTLICDCCGEVARDVDGQLLPKPIKVYLGDSANSIEEWCWWCYDLTFPIQEQKNAQSRFVSQIERWGYVS